MMKLSDFKVGDKFEVSTNFGGGPIVKAVVVGVDSDIKNGRPGLEYTTLDNKDECYWCYLTQVVRKL